MKLSKLKNAHALLERITILDREMEYLEQSAFKLKDGQEDLKMTISYLKPKSGEDILETENSPLMFSWGFGTHPTQQDTREALEFPIDEVVALSLLGYIMQGKRAEKQSIIERLSKGGIEVNQ